MREARVNRTPQACGGTKIMQTKSRNRRICRGRIVLSCSTRPRISVYQRVGRIGERIEVDLVALRVAPGDSTQPFAKAVAPGEHAVGR